MAISNLTQLDIVSSFYNYTDINARICRFIKRTTGYRVGIVSWRVIDKPGEEPCVRVDYTCGILEAMFVMDMSYFIKEINK